jgi:hypothetical protein
MIAVFSYPDALVVGAFLTASGTGLATWWNSHQAVKQTRPNGGSSMRDVIDRIETKLDTHTELIAAHGERIAALEAHPATRTPRKKD